MEEEELYSPVDQLSAISSMLKLASKHGLGAEVVLSALEAMKGDSRITPVQAMKEGLYEWDI
jgi:hypothetical protein